METAILTRTETGKQGTFGRIVLGGLALFTGELPWRDNRNDVSCEAPGTYKCAETFSPHFKRMLYLLSGTGSRFGVRIHPANFMGDKTIGLKCQLNGCIALGEKIGTMDGQKAILLSTPAVRRFMAALNDKPFTLVIRNGYS